MIIRIFSVVFQCTQLATEHVLNISRYDTSVASYGFKVDHTYLSHDAVETLTALTMYWALGSIKLRIKP